MIFKVLSLGISFALNVIGILMVITMVKRIDVSRIENGRVYKLLSKHNFTMYLIHQQIIYIIVDILNGMINPYLLALVSFVLAILLSLLIAVVLSKIPKVKKVFGYKDSPLATSGD